MVLKWLNKVKSFRPECLKIQANELATASFNTAVRQMSEMSQQKSPEMSQ